MVLKYSIGIFYYFWYSVITATLYTTPYLAHWLHTRFGNPVSLPRGSHYRDTFVSFLGKQYYENRGRIRVEVTVNKNIVSAYGHTIRMDRCNRFNNILLEELDRTIYDFVNAHKDTRGSIDAAIALFQERMKFEEHIFSFDNIRQRYYRYKRELKNNFHSSVTKTKAA